MGDPEITTTSSRIAYENRWMRVREDRIAYADGTPGLYGVVEKRDFVLVVARDDDDRLHLVEQYRYPIRQRQWEFPQGLMEAGETDHAACARRELDTSRNLPDGNSAASEFRGLPSGRGHVRGVFGGVQLLDPACVMAFPPPAGIIAGTGIARALAGAPRWLSVAMAERHASRPSDDLLVLAYRARGQQDGAAPYDAYCTSTYRKAGDRWRLAQHQQTPA